MSRLTPAARRLFTPDLLWAFAAGTVCLSLIGNALYDLAGRLLPHGWTPAAVVLLALLSLSTVVLLVDRALNRVRPSPPEISKARPDRRRGLILMVSSDPPCRRAIQYHRPALERCWLITSLARLDMARAIKSDHADVCLDDPIVINDVFNPLEYRDRVAGLYEQLPAGWSEADVIADFLGMTSCGSVGMVLACMATTRPLQYTMSAPAGGDGRKEPADPIEIVIDWHVIGARPLDDHAGEG